MSFIDVQQNTEAWDELRLGMVTGSGFAKVMAHYGKDFGEPAKEYAHKLALERLTQRKIQSNYRSADMDRGHEEEPIARMTYEDETFSTVLNGGFFTHDEYSWVGVSPDGRIENEKRLLEIKCVIYNIMRKAKKTVKKNGFDPQYKWQKSGQLWVSGYEMLDYFVFCSQYPEGKQGFTHTIDRDDFKDEIKMLEDRVPEFLKLVEKEQEMILNG